MKATPNSQTWWSAAVDRQRSLAITGPLQSLEAFKSHVGGQKHDVRTYCLYVIDQVVLGMRAHCGERFDVIRKALGDLITRCEPEISAELKGRLSAYVIDGLLNARGRGEPFTETLTIFDSSGTVRRERYPFTLLEAKDIGDDDFYLVASSQAIRLYTDLLARDVTDEQVANEYGLGLMLVSQRPSEVEATVLSQCNSWIVLRITNDADREHVRSILPDSMAGLTKMLSGLRRQEAIFVGQAAMLPSRISIRSLAPNQLPRSHDIDFDKGWQNPAMTTDQLKAIATRWRYQQR